MSHPSRVRGLKCGLVLEAQYIIVVAPFTGAWIEMSSSWADTRVSRMSHPSRVRGLKYVVGLTICLLGAGRTLHGCVD